MTTTNYSKLNETLELVKRNFDAHHDEITAVSLSTAFTLPFAIAQRLLELFVLQLLPAAGGGDNISSVIPSDENSGLPVNTSRWDTCGGVAVRYVVVVPIGLPPSHAGPCGGLGGVRKLICNSLQTAKDLVAQHSVEGLPPASIKVYSVANNTTGTDKDNVSQLEWQQSRRLSIQKLKQSQSSDGLWRHPSSVLSLPNGAPRVRSSFGMVSSQINTGTGSSTKAVSKSLGQPAASSTGTAPSPQFTTPKTNTDTGKDHKVAGSVFVKIGTATAAVSSVTGTTTDKCAVDEASTHNYETPAAVDNGGTGNTGSSGTFETCNAVESLKRNRDASSILTKQDTSNGTDSVLGSDVASKRRRLFSPTSAVQPAATASDPSPAAVIEDDRTAPAAPAATAKPSTRIGGGYFVFEDSKPTAVAPPVSAGPPVAAQPLSSALGGKEVLRGGQDTTAASPAPVKGKAKSRSKSGGTNDSIKSFFGVVKK